MLQSLQEASYSSFSLWPCHSDDLDLNQLLDYLFRGTAESLATSTAATTTFTVGGQGS